MLQEKVTPLDLVLVICTSVVTLGVLVELAEGLLARVAHDVGIDVVGPARVVGETGCDQPSRHMDQLLPSQSMDHVVSFDI